MNKLVNLMLDSGAFSAWRLHKPIELSTYIEFLQEHKSYLWQMVALDHIPGTWGKPRTRADVENSARKSSINWHVMRKAGLNTIPVFHQGENFTWLERMIQDGARYIGISPSDDTRDEDQQRWMDDVFTLLTTDDGVPLIKTHGFGIGNMALLRRFPFYSVDSTTWVLTTGFGQILVPPLKKDGKFDYLAKPIRVITSGQMQSSASMQAMQFEALSPIQQDCVVRFVEEETQSNMGLIRYDARARRKAALIYYRNLERATIGLKFKQARRGFLYQSVDTRNLHPLHNMPLHIVFATLPDGRRSELLNEMNCNTRLLSYWMMRKHPEKVRTYVETGHVNPDWKPKAPPSNWSTADKNHRSILKIKRLMRLDKEQSTKK